MANSSHGQREGSQIRTWFPSQVARQACDRLITFSPTICKSRSVTVAAFLASEQGTLGKGAPSGWYQSLFSWVQSKQLEHLLFFKVFFLIHITTAHCRKFGKWRKAREMKNMFPSLPQCSAHHLVFYYLSQRVPWSPYRFQFSKFIVSPTRNS